MMIGIMISHEITGLSAHHNSCGGTNYSARIIYFYPFDSDIYFLMNDKKCGRQSQTVISNRERLLLLDIVIFQRL